MWLLRLAADGAGSGSQPIIVALITMVGSVLVAVVGVWGTTFQRARRQQDEPAAEPQPDDQVTEDELARWQRRYDALCDDRDELQQQLDQTYSEMARYRELYHLLRLGVMAAGHDPDKLTMDRGTGRGRATPQP